MVRGGNAYQLSMTMDDLRDTLASESLLPEPALDVVEDASVGRV